jgi:putative Mg2+ transporter-C (MgtC) family protein
MNVRGLNTAATMWASAAVGCCAGADMIALSAALTLFVIAGNTLLRPLVNANDRIPLNEQASEADYEVIVTTDANKAADVLSEQLEAAKYPIRETNVVYRSNDNVEISTRLVSLAVDPKDLDTVVAELSKLTGVRHATCNVTSSRESRWNVSLGTVGAAHSPGAGLLAGEGGTGTLEYLL